MSKSAEYQIVIIGAGAAGIAASKLAMQHNINHIIVEASNRIGGRGLTQTLGQTIPIDLGCHWLHSASLNPYVTIAKDLGFHWECEPLDEKIYFNNRWLSELEAHECWDYFNLSNRQIDHAAENNRDVAISDVIDNKSKWLRLFNYFTGLSHSVDVDQVSVFDHATYNDTGEDWPVKEGFGNLIARFGNDCPVVLNNPILRIYWQQKGVRLQTPNGEILTKKVIITVPTSIINAGDIQFIPSLPVAKQEDYSNLVMGNYNNLFFEITTNYLDDFDKRIIFYDRHHELHLKVKPFGYRCVFATIGGRQARWLEKQGSKVTENFFKEILIKIFGTDIRSSLGQFKSSSWGTNPWIKGAYSAARPTHAKSRQTLWQPIDEKLYFAGEATSVDALCTVHGAHLSGERAMQACITDLHC